MGDKDGIVSFQFLEFMLRSTLAALSLMDSLTSSAFPTTVSLAAPHRSCTVCFALSVSSSDLSDAAVPAV